MENWRMQLVVVTFCVLVQTSKGLTSGVEEERGMSRDWQNESQETDMRLPISTLMKRAKALRFYGLMGKRSGTKKPFKVNRRNKGQAFVGLMGRSISSGESLIPPFMTTAIEVSDKPHKQGLPEEWIQILY